MISRGRGGYGCGVSAHAVYHSVSQSVPQTSATATAATITAATVTATTADSQAVTGLTKKQWENLVRMLGENTGAITSTPRMWKEV
ncbi:unnamed protein product [Arabis nemorensis]|uniref:Uncharacterized protein n=1 Tax=Arabis nemorensis TaxID=586526 RepID=A0A565CP39_9BRAS|nr:unnamed protein product [Arabis nemorensis]